MLFLGMLSNIYSAVLHQDTNRARHCECPGSGRGRGSQRLLSEAPNLQQRAARHMIRSEVDFHNAIQ